MTAAVFSRFDWRIVVVVYSLTDSRADASDAAVEPLAPADPVLLGPTDGGDSVSEATLPEWLFRLYQSATMPLSVDWLEHWLVCRAPSLLRQLAPLLLLLLLLLLLPALLLLTDMIECGRFAIESRSEGNATIELRNLGAAENRIRVSLVKRKQKKKRNNNNKNNYYFIFNCLILIIINTINSR